VDVICTLVVNPGNVICYKAPESCVDVICTLVVNPGNVICYKLKISYFLDD